MFQKPFRHAVVFVTFLVFVSSSLMAAPKVSFDKDSFDFGNVVSGKKIVAEFTLKNIGDSELSIRRIRSDCGCTVAKIDKNKLASGELSIVKVEFDSTGYSGSISKEVTVINNDPDDGKHALRITANIITTASFRPERLNFGSIKVKNTRTHTVQIIPVDPKTFEINKIEPLGTHVVVSGYKKISDPNGDFWEVTLAIKAGNDPGRVMETVRILTKGDGVQKLSFTVYGNVIE